MHVFLENHKGYHFRSLRNGDEGECKHCRKSRNDWYEFQEHVVWIK